MITVIGYTGWCRDIHFRVMNAYRTKGEEKMPREGAESLIGAISKAKGRKLNVNDFGDRLLMQKGCFILNEMGVLPRYKFGLYVRGPYSSDLADDYYEILSDDKKDRSTSVPEPYIEALSEIMKKSAAFVEAYATLMLARNYNPEMDAPALMDFVVKLKPRLKKNIEEAAEYLNPIPSAI